MRALETKGRFPGSFSRVPDKRGQTHVHTPPWGAACSFLGTAGRCDGTRCQGGWCGGSLGGSFPSAVLLAHPLTLDTFSSSENQAEHEAALRGRCPWSEEG